MENSSSKNVTFKLENENLNTSSNSKKLTLSDLPKIKNNNIKKIKNKSENQNKKYI